MRASAKWVACLFACCNLTAQNHWTGPLTINSEIAQHHPLRRIGGEIYDFSPAIKGSLPSKPRAGFFSWDFEEDHLREARCERLNAVNIMVSGIIVHADELGAWLQRTSPQRDQIFIKNLPPYLARPGKYILIFALPVGITKPFDAPESNRTIPVLDFGTVIHYYKDFSKVVYVTDQGLRNWTLRLESLDTNVIPKVVLWQMNQVAKGFPSAQFDLGRRRLTGDGVFKDEAEGMRLIRRAAEAGYLPARNFLDKQNQPKP